MRTKKRWPTGLPPGMQDAVERGPCNGGEERRCQPAAWIGRTTSPGVTNGYALEDRVGNGVVYVSHIYIPGRAIGRTSSSPWRRNIRSLSPKSACPPDYKSFDFIPPRRTASAGGLVGGRAGPDPEAQAPLDGFQFSHPHCGPMVISDWDYTPTRYWGVFVKDALSGKQFELKKMR